MMPLTQSSWKATPWAPVGWTITVALLRPAAAAWAKAGGVTGSKRPAMSRVGMSETTGASTAAGSWSTRHRAQVSTKFCRSSRAVAAISGRRSFRGSVSGSTSLSSAQTTEKYMPSAMSWSKTRSGYMAWM